MSNTTDSLFTYVNNQDIESFKENINEYQNKISFLGDTGEIATKGNIYGINKQELEESQKVQAEAIYDLYDKVETTQLVTTKALIELYDKSDEHYRNESDLNSKITSYSSISTIESETLESVNGNKIYSVLIPINNEINTYNGDTLSNSYICPYLSNLDNHLEIETGNIIKDNYIITESKMIGECLYDNLSLYNNDSVVKMYSLLPLGQFIDNIEGVIIKYYVKGKGSHASLYGKVMLETGAVLWCDSFDNDRNVFAFNEGFETWEEYMESFFENDPFESDNNIYKYAGYTMEWNGETYYVWEDDVNDAFFILTDTIDYQTLYDRSLEANYSNNIKPYVALFSTEDNENTYRASETTDILVAVKQENNELYLTFDDFIDAETSPDYIAIENEYSKWEDIYEDFDQFVISLGDAKPKKYIYSGTTFNYDGETYYLWELDDNYDYDYSVAYMLTNTIDYWVLFDNSLEFDKNSTYNPAIVLLNEDNEDGYDAKGKNLRIMRVEQ